MTNQAARAEAIIDRIADLEPAAQRYLVGFVETLADRGRPLETLDELLEAVIEELHAKGGESWERACRITAVHLEAAEKRRQGLL